MFQSFRAFYGYSQESFNKLRKCKKIPHKKNKKKQKLFLNLQFCIRSGLDFPCKKKLCFASWRYFGKLKIYLTYNVNLSKSVGKDKVFLGLAGLLLDFPCAPP